MRQYVYEVFGTVKLALWPFSDHQSVINLNLKCARSKPFNNGVEIQDFVSEALSRKVGEGVPISPNTYRVHSISLLRSVNTRRRYKKK